MQISIRMLGELQVFHNNLLVRLPASKRSRALLAYLAFTARPHRRDRLCEVFWEVPDDPKGALRWSLSKIRPLVNDADTERLQADRERVSLVSSDISIDLHQLKADSQRNDLSIAELESLLQQSQQPFLQGLDLPDQSLFQDWLTAERNELQQLTGKLQARLASHTTLSSPDNWHTIEPPASRELLARQKVQFCTAHDGVRIAYASVGKGPTIVKAANWLSHLEHDWNAPIWSPLFRDLAADHHFVRYDERGNGLSDWDVADISFSAFVTDLETVVDANKLDKFALLGISQGAAVSIEYAIRYPEKVSHLILFGGYAAGWRIGATEALTKEREAVMTLTAVGWGTDNPAYRQIFSSTFMPDANEAEFNWFNDFQRLTTSAENAVRFLSVFADIDVRHRLAQVKVPTLVIHAMGDQRIPISVGRDIAAAIPNAEFVGLESNGHLLLGREPASKTFVQAIRDFMARHQ
ncbi:alpha/beta hydrolase [Rheinheimera sp. EpRS3]|uniref:alpha/beta hydrolase n=1 Tax=Rheinheimera sp. EpRS3 TaxID=1712383 RepID=UPI000A83D347|nr:alpha/beta hydrolase [Rheinheimera sp. EpRS3]